MSTRSSEVGMITVEDVDGLPSINRRIHDYTFELDQVKLVGTTVTIHVFEPKSRRWFWPFALTQDMRHVGIGSVVIHEVEELSISDLARVGFYPLNRIDYDPIVRVVSIRTNIPLGLDCRVKHLRISFEPDVAGEGGS